MPPSQHTGASGTPKQKRPPSLFKVQRTERLTPQMMRVALTGDRIDAFSQEHYAGHIKLMLPRPGQTVPHLPTLGENGPIWPSADERPIVRTYTIRACQNGELLIDFVLHQDEGPASQWAQTVQPGAIVGIAGPAGPCPMLKPADMSLLAGDTSALPAIAAMLEQMPANAQGYALIEVPDRNERLPLTHPEGVEVIWLERGNTMPNQSTRLLDMVKTLDLGDGTSLFAWAAGENSIVISLRNYLRSTYGLQKPMLYAVPYWKQSLNEESYHQERHRVMDEL